MWESTLFGRTGRSIRAWKAARSVAFSLSPRDPTRLRSNRGQKTQRSNGCVCARESTSLEGDRSPERSKLQSAEARRMVVWFKMTNFGKLGGRERERERAFRGHVERREENVFLLVETKAKAKTESQKGLSRLPTCVGFNYGELTKLSMIEVISFMPFLADIKMLINLIGIIKFQFLTVINLFMLLIVC